MGDNFLPSLNPLSPGVKREPIPCLSYQDMKAFTIGAGLSTIAAALFIQERATKFPVVAKHTRISFSNEFSWTIHITQTFPELRFYN
jgi:hypothetical protein